MFVDAGRQFGKVIGEVVINGKSHTVVRRLTAWFPFPAKRYNLLSRLSTILHQPAVFQRVEQ